jgi:hypothetical protein
MAGIRIPAHPHRLALKGSNHASRATTAAGLTAIALASIPLTLPGTAHASTSISCTTTGTTSFEPAVQTYTQAHKVSLRSDRAVCVDRSDIGITSARFTLRFDDTQLDCTELDFGTGSGSATIVWTLNGGSRLTSRAYFSAAETFLNTADFSGGVTAGPFAGQRFSGQVTADLLGPKGRCGSAALTGGVKSTTSHGMLTIGT